MPKCFSPTLVAALVGMLMVVGEAQQQEQLGEACTCQKAWDFNGGVPFDNADFLMVTYNGCAIVSTDPKAWCYTTNECSTSSPSTSNPGQHWSYCKLPITTTTVRTVTTANKTTRTATTVSTTTTTTRTTTPATSSTATETGTTTTMTVSTLPTTSSTVTTGTAVATATTTAGSDEETESAATATAALYNCIAGAIYHREISRCICPSQMLTDYDHDCYRNEQRFCCILPIIATANARAHVDTDINGTDAAESDGADYAAQTVGTGIYLHEGTCDRYDDALNVAVAALKDAVITRPLSWSRLAGGRFSHGFKAGWDLLAEQPLHTNLTADLIKEVNRRVVEQDTAAAQRGSRSIPGGVYRTHAAWVMEKTFQDPSTISASVASLLQKINNDRYSSSTDSAATVFDRAAHLMASILAIHPFADGNGRTSVLLGNWVLRQSGFRTPIDFQLTKTLHEDFIFSLWVFDHTSSTTPLARALQESYVHAVADGAGSSHVVDVLRGSGCAPAHAVHGFELPSATVGVTQNDRTRAVQLDIKGALPSILYSRMGTEGHALFADYMRTEDAIFAGWNWELKEQCKGEYMQQNFEADHFSYNCKGTKQLRDLLSNACLELDDCSDENFQAYAEAYYKKLQAANRNFLVSSLSLVEGDDFLVYGDQIVLKDTTDAVVDAVRLAFFANFHDIVSAGMKPRIDVVRFNLKTGVSFEQKTDVYVKYARFQQVLGKLGNQWLTHTMRSLFFQPAHVESRHSRDSGTTSFVYVDGGTSSPATKATATLTTSVYSTTTTLSSTPTSATPTPTTSSSATTRDSSTTSTTVSSKIASISTTTISSTTSRISSTTVSSTAPSSTTVSSATTGVSSTTVSSTTASISPTTTTDTATTTTLNARQLRYNGTTIEELLDGGAQVDELIEKGFTLLELVQAPSANITVEVLEDAGVSADEIAVLRTTLVDPETGSGGNTGTIVAVVVGVLLLLVLLLLFYRRRNKKPVLLPEDPDAHVTQNKLFEIPQYSAADAGAADGDGQLHPPPGLATGGTPGSNTAVAVGNGDGVYYDADPVDAGDPSSVVYATPLDDDDGAGAQALYRPVYDDSMLAPIQDADLYDDGAPVPDGSAVSTAEPHVAVVECGDVIYNSNDAGDEPATCSRQQQPAVVYSFPHATRNAAAGTGAATEARHAGYASSSSTIYATTGNGDSDIYRAVHGEAGGGQSANAQLYAVPTAADDVGSGDGRSVGTFDLSGTVVVAASSGAYEVVGTGGLYAPPPAAAGGGLRRKPSVYNGFGDDANA